MKRRFIQCDVFSGVPARGNGLAVVLDGKGVSEAEMRAFARWTNLAETTFLLPPEDPAADYRVRIFTPTREMPFAGHPTLGSCASWLHAGGKPKNQGKVVQECAIGLVEIDQTGRVPAFVAPPTSVEPLGEARLSAILAASGIEAARVLRSAYLVNGPHWQVLELESAADVLAIDAARLGGSGLPAIGFTGRHAAGETCDYEVRMIDATDVPREDPITGSLNAAIARWMRAEGRLTGPVTVAQGTAIGRVGRVFVTPDPSDPERTLIGGETTIMIEGTLDF
ncbi:PhzF family phenazine biosynthesis protein [Antarcticirhabdus aurantiaca]|uniref:PhzF family phenazine biosynthesis protein n=1 Tax=Antarcticirhabdus aurantiaca TaxID=2606717 RepID=A0ACD4NSZ7_9HYPH|nr:PhzF family phenazine biosynthesis protein [Antarcticirhabdus aurantiaca]WAJ29878.1 PhzF family phenazine biosynthesis protein [Jeongeuplla avenae]